MVLTEFLKDFHLHDDHGEIQFGATIEYHEKDNCRFWESNVLIKRNAGSEIIILLNKNIPIKEFDVGNKNISGTIIYSKNKYLSIEGENAKYLVHIIPLIPARKSNKMYKIWLFAFLVLTVLSVILFYKVR